MTAPAGALTVAHMPAQPDGRCVGRARSGCCAQAERPVFMAGTDSTGARASSRCPSSPRRFGIPVFLNGLARGCLPADHELFFSRARRRR